MGCDIHLYTELKRKINKENKWVSADRFKLNPGNFNPTGDGGVFSLPFEGELRLYRIQAYLMSFWFSGCIFQNAV